MSGFATRLLRGVIAVFAGLLIAGGTLTIAAGTTTPQRPTLVPVAQGPKTLTVPQVTGQAFVFAKGILQDSGLAWRVLGPVKGYAPNTVVDQVPAPGSLVLDTGAPTVTLTLARNPAYVQLGTPENTSPYPGTALRLPAGVPPARAVPLTSARPAPSAGVRKRRPAALRRASK